MRFLSHPPMTPGPDVRVCADCGWGEFCIPKQWLSAGWLRPLRNEPGPSVVASTPNATPQPSASQMPPQARESIPATAEFAPAA